MLHTILYILFLVVFIYCALSVGYLFFLSVAGRIFYRNKFSGKTSEPQKRIAVLVPAYKEDGIIVSTAKNLMSLNYPSSLYDVYIIADSFQASTISQLRQLPVEVFEVSFEKSTKTKSLNEAFSRIRKEYDVALILDADNLLAKDFLQKINNAFVKGAHAVQGRRVAKNLNTSFAILDACSEGINNHIFRKGTNAAGLSSAVIGSGMAFDFDLVKDILSRIDAVGGFDKPLQLNIVKKGIRIEYLDDALVFDEKVDSSQAFRQQRKRWVSSQFIYLRKFFLPSFGQLLKGNLSYFNLAVGNNLVLPRAFLFMILPLLAIVALFLVKAWFTATIVIWLAYLLALFIAIPPELLNRELWQAILKLPKAIGIMLGTLLGMKESNKTFIHTVHTKTDVSNPLFNENNQ